MRNRRQRAPLRIVAASAAATVVVGAIVTILWSSWRNEEDEQVDNTSSVDDGSPITISTEEESSIEWSPSTVLGSMATSKLSIQKNHADKDAVNLNVEENKASYISPVAHQRPKEAAEAEHQIGSIKHDKTGAQLEDEVGMVNTTSSLSEGFEMVVKAKRLFDETADEESPERADSPTSQTGPSKALDSTTKSCREPEGDGAKSQILREPQLAATLLKFSHSPLMDDSTTTAESSVTDVPEDVSVQLLNGATPPRRRSVFGARVASSYINEYSR